MVDSNVENRKPQSVRANSERPPSDESFQETPLNAGVNAGRILEGVDDSENAEFGLGNVSEKAGENIGEHQKSTAGKFQQFQKQMTKEEADRLKKQLLKSPPSKPLMIREIRTQVHREILQLHSKEKYYRRKSAFAELARVVKRLRELHGILTQLLHSTAEVVRNLWLKVVHGIA